MRPSGWKTSALVLAAALGLTGCGAIKGAAIKTVANTLAEPGDTFTSDNDPELVRKAVPFALKLYETLLVSVPKNDSLLLAACSGYTGYSYAFVETDADLLSETEHHDEIAALRDEAELLYLRARDYCLRAMDVRYPGLRQAMDKDAVNAVKRVTKKADVALLYWTAASWGAAMAVHKDPMLLIDFPAVRAMAERALALDETYSSGAIHELLLGIDAQGEMYGGSEDKARQHFDRAVRIQEGRMAGPYVSLALSVAMPKGDRAEFETLLEQAAAIDPEQRKSDRLINIIAIRRAKALLARIDELMPKTPGPGAAAAGPITKESRR